MIEFPEWAVLLRYPRTDRDVLTSFHPSREEASAALTATTVPAGALGLVARVLDVLIGYDESEAVTRSAPMEVVVVDGRKVDGERYRVHRPDCADLSLLKSLNARVEYLTVTGLADLIHCRHDDGSDPAEYFDDYAPQYRVHECVGWPQTRAGAR